MTMHMPDLVCGRFPVLLSVALAAGLVGSALSLDAEFADGNTAFAREALQPFVDTGELPGAVSVFCDGERRETCCVGFADVKAKRPINLDDPFQQCSQTKGFCGVTAAILVEEGKLGLDDPVAKYLPEFGALWVKDAVSSNFCRHVRVRTLLTVRMCLNHTGGFPFELPSYTAMGGWSRRMPLRSVAACAAALPLEFEPGTEARYSNLGIDIAAAVVEVVSGKRWEDFLKERVLDPLDMRQTTFRPTDEQVARRIRIYETGAGRTAVEKPFAEAMQPPYADDRVFASAGAGLWTTARDQLKFYRMLMNLGVGDNGVRVLGEETVRRLLAVSSRPADLKKQDWTKDGYSLGFCAPVADGEDRWFGHGGAWRTRCHVNWHRKQLKLLVVQVVGEAPWDDPLAAAADRFFGSSGGAADDSRSSGRLGEASEDDAARNKSTEMNASAYVGGSTSVTGGVRVLFLGNSITLHGPLASIGWTNNWGMAASAPERDFVHLVTRGIEERTGRRADVRVYNAANIVRRYREADCDLSELDGYVAFRPDYLVVALGENAPQLKTDGDRLAFRRLFERIFGRFVYGRMQPNAAVRGVFWPNPAKDHEIAHAASDFSFPFVSISDLGADPSMKALGLFPHEGVANHPGDKGMRTIADRILEVLFPTASGYRATVDGRSVAVRPVRVSSMPFNQWAADYQRPMDQTEVAGTVSVEADGATSWRVTPNRPFTNAVIRPLVRGVRPAVEGGAVAFTLPKPGFYVLELDGEHRPLEIFVNRTRDFAAERAAANIVFGPGLHEPVVVKLRSHDRVYIDRDAVVKGSFQVDGAEDVVVSGYGIIDGGRNRRVGNACYRDGMDGAVRIIDSKHVTFDGPTIVDSCCWMVSAFNSSDLTFANLKVTGAWRYNTDGIDICNSQRVRIRDCYVHSFDDSIVLKGIPQAKYGDDPEEDIAVERCVCWCSWGNTLENGLETWAPRFRDIRFEDCDLIHNSAVALSVHLGGPARLENIVFRNIRVEMDSPSLESVIQKDRDQVFVAAERESPGCLYAVRNRKMFGGGFYKGDGRDYSKEPHGTVDGLTIEDVTVFVDRDRPPPEKRITPVSGTAFGSVVVRGIRSR